MNEQNGKPHDIEQVWKTVNSLQEGQAKSQSEVAGLSARMSGVEHKLDSLATMLTNFVMKPQREFNWFGLFSILISIAAVAGMLVQANLSPIRKQADETQQLLMARYTQLQNDYRDFGKMDSSLATANNEIPVLRERVYRLSEDVAACKQDRESMHKQLDAVDFGGSRKHVMSIPDAMKIKGE